ncbi:sushi, von Willebrand factor type A, EGF and pentraxin domain-containing protein 1-like [Clavelina lepadiformis]|uniref:sushi, von Willebrand factor type A, EGF and pentraxin domain-containing protein 1-like n=1 Tax=Clavelina lepadiformis TaxID=159417 RepID=UPI0040424725
MIKYVIVVICAVAVSLAQYLPNRYTPSSFRLGCHSNPPLPSFGRIKRYSQEHNLVYYACDDCYTLRGYTYNQCLRGRWRHPAPYCHRKNACQLGTDRPCHENAICRSYDGGKYTCTCKDGYSGNGKNSLFNGKCATFVGEIKINGCGKNCEPFMTTGMLSPLPRTDHFDFAYIYCLPGYTADEVIAFCLFGRWQEDVLCKPVTCTVPSAPQNGTVSPSAGLINFGKSVMYSCRSSTMLIGAEVAICKENGEFDLPPPHCLYLEEERMLEGSG